MEYFYEVYVAGNFHGSHGLTYSSDKELSPGQIVQVPLRQKIVLGVIKKPVTKPQIKVKLLEALPLPALPVTHLQLMGWMKEYYPAALGAIVQLFMPPSLVKKLEFIEPDFTKPQTSVLPKLTDEQRQAIANLKRSSTNFLHGETGSGKTRVYQELVLECINAGKSAIVLSPEIGLSSQIFNDFYKLFGDRVVLFHSNLTPAERRGVWLKILNSSAPLVVIGARSALFIPLKHIGLIVIDEAHDSAYKQDQAPYYQAIRVAGKLAQLSGATLLLATATPDVTDYYIAEQKKAAFLRLKNLAISKPASVDIEIIDLKNRAEFSRSGYLSNQLINEINGSLKNHEQTLLFLNRRGTARTVACQNCGWQALCPHCDTTLIYHGDTHSFMCHVCNYKTPAVSSCPICGSSDIIFKGAGTKAIVSEVQKLFPSTIIQRFDADNLKNERLEQNYQKVKDGSVDIIVGTQTLTKGLDLPKLGLVGIITADSSLFMPDYLAQERTYQQLSQVIGRVGRGHRNGRVIVQTYYPEGEIIKDVLKKDWQNFYKKELSEREKYKFPPFYYLLRISCKRASSDKAKNLAEQFSEQLSRQYPKIIISGPAPAYHEKQGNKYEWQIILKSKSRSALVEIIKNLPAAWSYDLEPVNLL